MDLKFILWNHCHISQAPMSQRLRPLQRLHNERDGVSNHQPHDCLLNRLLKARIKETSKFRITGICEGHRSPVNSPHKWSVTRKIYLMTSSWIKSWKVNICLCYYITAIVFLDVGTSCIVWMHILYHIFFIISHFLFWTYSQMLWLLIVCPWGLLGGRTKSPKET